MSRRHITVEWSGGSFRINGYSKRDTESLGRAAIDYLEKTRAIREAEHLFYSGVLEGGAAHGNGGGVA